MKKKIFISFLTCGLGILCFFIFNNLKRENEILSNKISNFENNYSSLYLTLNSLNYETFQHMVDEGEEFYIYFGRPTCGDCTMFEPIMDNLIKEYKLESDIYYLNLKNIYENKLAWKSFEVKYNIKHTPTLAKFKNGKIENLVEWTKETGFTKNMVTTWLESNKLKNKEI